MIRALRFLAIAATITMVTIIGRVVYLSRHPGSDIQRARGYEHITGLFLRHAWLSFDDGSTRVALGGQAGLPVQTIFRRSFLRSDVEQFNGGERSIFKIENQQIAAVDTTRHNVLLPFGNVDLWYGTLRYRPSGTLEASLRGIGIDIVLRGLTTAVLDHTSPKEVTIRGDLDPEPVSHASAEIVNVFGAPAVYLGKLHLAEDKVVVNNRNTPASVSMSLSGTRLPQGNRAWLAPGDLLKLEWHSGTLGRSRYALLFNEGGRSADAISVPCAINGKWDRCPEEPSLALAGDIVSTLNSGVSSKTAASRNDFDVVITLDRRLNQDVQTALERNRRPQRGVGAGASPVRRTTTRAAVTVMNTLTGEILALASYPTKTALARLNLSAAAEARLLRNHNFSRMPVGSVAKVVLGAAIVDADPRLLSLKLRQHAGTSVANVAGIQIDPPIESHPVRTGDDGLVDFREFIQYSSNEYAALLLTLASATRHDTPLPVFTGPLLPTQRGQNHAEGAYTIDGHWYDRAPSPAAGETRLNLGSGRGGAVVAGTLSNLEGEPWGDSFLKLFDVDKIVSTPVDGRPPAQGDQVIDTSMWAPVLTQLYGENVPHDHPLRAVGFERENLALNLTHVYRTELLSLMYGGAAARFTNPKLCEMFSRLVTGRKVTRALLLGVTPAGGDVPRSPQNPPALDFRPELRGEVLRAMSGVAHGGTANAVYNSLVRIDRALAAKHQALGFFSKTGSPRNTIAVPSGLSRAVNALIASSAVALNGQGVLQYRGIPVFEDNEGDGVPPSLRAILDNTTDRAVLRRYGVSARLLHDALLLYNIEPPERRDQLYVTRLGRLFSMQGVREIPSTGAVYVFTMAVYDATARRTAAPLDVDPVGHLPQRAWTIAINIEGQGKSTDVAVPFAEALIDGVIWPALQDESR